MAHTAKAISANDVSNGDSVVFLPGRAVSSMGRGDEGSASQDLDDRLQEDLPWPNTYYDDLRVSVSATEMVGSNAPDYAFFANDGSGAPTANALQFYSGSTESDVSDGGNLPWDFAHSVTMWLYPSINMKNGDYYFNKIDMVALRHWNQDKIRVYYNGASAVSDISLGINQWNHVAFTTNNSGVVNIYINGISVGQFDAGSLNNSEVSIDFNPDGGEFIIDDLCIWDGERTQIQIVSDYNLGFGTAKSNATSGVNTLWTFETIITDGGKMIDADGAEPNSDWSLLLDGTEDTDYALVDGLVSSTAIDSRGIAVRAFEALKDQELQFEVQMPHGWKQGSDIKAHLHWVPLSDIEEELGEDDELLGPGWHLEYTWSNVGEAFGNTTIISSNEITVGSGTTGTHNLTALGTIDGEDKALSSMLLCRIFRGGTDEEYDVAQTSAVGLLEVDFHFEINAPGSREEYTK